MKKYTRAFLGFSILLSLLMFVSCSSYLNKAPQSTISPTQPFKDFTNFQGFVEQIYAGIPDFTNAYWTNNWNWGDGIVTSTDMNYQVVNMFDQGNFWGWQAAHNGWNTSWMDKAGALNPNASDGSGIGPGGGRFNTDLWHDGWYSIRQADLGLEHINDLQGTQEEKNLIKGQLLFFRAWYYFQFMQYFGGLPYITKPLPADQPFNQTRLSYQATADSAAKDFQEAANLLPINWDNTAPGKQTLGNNTIRINKIMALGYLGKDLLWAGSPLMNYSSTGSKSYNQKDCQLAAQAFAQVLELCQTGQAPYKLVPFSEYHTLWYTMGQDWKMPGGTEAIFRGPYYGANNSNWGTSKQYQPGIIQDGSNFFPTANYVDNFGMANGLPITDPNSGYNPEYPWRNRDPRFYKDFIYDGEKVVQGSMPADQEQYRYASLYTGGAYRSNPAGSLTGYLLYKFIPITANKFDQGYNYGNNLNIHIPWMRLGGIYIMYAEAAAEGYQSPQGHAPGFNLTAVAAIDTIRARAGDGFVQPSYYASLDKFMGTVRREWAVELAFEKHRFTNLRRWMLLTDPKYLDKTGIDFQRSSTFSYTDPSQNKVLDLHEFTIIHRQYTDRDYWLPLPLSDVNISKGFSQNPGW